MFETLRYQIERGIMTITLNRPDRLNAFNNQMLQELLSVFDYADENDDVRVIVLTGEGKAFCAGADLENGSATFQEDELKVEEFRDSGGILSLRIFELKKPIISAINGAAVGIGITMTLPTDIRIASADAKMGFVFSRRGITPEACSGWFLPRIVGISKACEWVFSGRMISAAEAYNCGLVSRIVEPDQLLSAAYELAADIVENTSAVSVALSRQLLWRMLGADHPMESHKAESQFLHWTGKRPDAHEGVSSFLEKRKAEFQMKVSQDLPPFFPPWRSRTFHQVKE
ncbi:MAG TPA: crotonase/enoyl-CoA hydratase family protein [Chondromyces sp.]|nr:crotonase/enoyl-CoA hydratase family protein [Chondromyces sp.]